MGNQIRTNREQLLSILMQDQEAWEKIQRDPKYSVTGHLSENSQSNTFSLSRFLAYHEHQAGSHVEGVLRDYDINWMPVSAATKTKLKKCLMNGELNYLDEGSRQLLESCARQFASLDDQLQIVSADARRSSGDTRGDDGTLQLDELRYRAMLSRSTGEPIPGENVYQRAHGEALKALVAVISKQITGQAQKLPPVRLEDLKKLGIVRDKPPGGFLLNHSREVKIEVDYWMAPRSIDEVVLVVAFAEQHKISYKPLGSLHSFSDAALPQAPAGGKTMVLLPEMLGYRGDKRPDYGRPLISKIDKAVECFRPDVVTETPPNPEPLTDEQLLDSHNLVRVGAGTRLREISQKLAQWGYAFKNMGGYDGQTIAGVINTYTHGSGEEFPPFGDIVASMDMVIRGVKVRVERSNGPTDALRFKTDPTYKDWVLIQSDEFFNSAIGSMGTIGVAVSYVLDVGQLHHLKEKSERIPIEQMMQEIRGASKNLPNDVLDQHLHVEYYVNPSSKKAGRARFAIKRTRELAAPIKKPKRPVTSGVSPASPDAEVAPRSATRADDGADVTGMGDQVDPSWQLYPARKVDSQQSPDDKPQLSEAEQALVDAVLKLGEDATAEQLEQLLQDAERVGQQDASKMRGLGVSPKSLIIVVVKLLAFIKNYLQYSDDTTRKPLNEAIIEFIQLLGHDPGDVFTALFLHFPKYIPDIVDASLSGLVDEYTDYCYKVFHIGNANDIRANSQEIAIPLAHIDEYADDVLAIAKKFRTDQGKSVTAPYSLRFVAVSAAVLAPTQRFYVDEDGKTVETMGYGYFEFIFTIGTPWDKEMMRAFHAASRKYGGRSHPGQVDYDTHADMKKNYDLELFLAMREIADPNGLMLNNWNRGLFGIN